MTLFILFHHAFIGEGLSAMTKEEAIELAKQTLSTALQLGVEQIGVRHIDAVEWADTSLGCPETDMLYAQVITPGYRVVFHARGKLHVVHVGSHRAVVCRTRPETGAPGAR